MKFFLAISATLWCSVVSQLLSKLEGVLDIGLQKLTQYQDAMMHNDPRMHMNVIQLAKYYNYSAESHKVVTDDGYILKLHRFTGNQKNPNPEGKQPVLLVHGLLCSSMDWAIAGPGKGLAFILADLGYDVWMTNLRGSRYSLKHNDSSIEASVYWDFTLHELGTYDLPASIDYILESTGYDKIFYAGHNQGITTLFVTLSERPEYNDKIKTAFALAPAGFISHDSNPIFTLLNIVGPMFKAVMQIFGKYDINPTNKLTQQLSSFLCSDKQPTQALCTDSLFMVAGKSEGQLDKEMLPIFLAHTPAGCGYKQLRHYVRMIRYGDFSQFDYGTLQNLIKYKSLSPPSYNLGNVTAPISLHYAPNDLIATPTDVNKLDSMLPNVIGKFRVPAKQFNHIDFLWGRNAKDLVYDNIISIMKNQEKTNLKN